MRVSMDETRVEYLLRKCLDQFVCSLKNKQTIERMVLHCERRAFCRAHPLTSFKLNPCLLISSTLLILQPLQNSAVNTLCMREGRKRDRALAKDTVDVQLFRTAITNLTLLVCSQKTLGTQTKSKCFRSSAHLSEFLASFSKSSS